MPFNMAACQSGNRVFVLEIDDDDNSLNYVIASRILSQFGTSPRAGDIVTLNIGAVTLVASSPSVYCIDGDGLDEEVRLTINLDENAAVKGRGGVGGSGGSFVNPGNPGGTGGTAIRLGCPTSILGSGTIIAGGGGGGGGGGFSGGIGSRYGGGGGGGGAPLGSGGAGGLGGNGAGQAGDTATQTTGGAGGDGGGLSAGAGSPGGSPNGSGTVGGNSGTEDGGAGGSPGDAIHKNGFTLTLSEDVTLIGDNA